MNDTMAAGVYDYAIENNCFVGKDLLIGGIGSEISDYMRPKLTTIKLPLYDMGKMAAKVIFEIVNSGYSSSSEISYVQGKMINEDQGSILGC